MRSRSDARPARRRHVLLFRKSRFPGQRTQDECVPSRVFAAIKAVTAASTRRRGTHLRHQRATRRQRRWLGRRTERRRRNVLRFKRVSLLSARRAVAVLGGGGGVDLGWNPVLAG